MKRVGIKELKMKLSGYVNETKAGASIIITDHGEEIALISPLSEEYRLITALEKSGMAHWTRGKPEGLKNPIEVRGKAISTTILEERE